MVLIEWKWNVEISDSPSRFFCEFVLRWAAAYTYITLSLRGYITWCQLRGPGRAGWVRTVRAVWLCGSTLTENSVVSSQQQWTAHSGSWTVLLLALWPLRQWQYVTLLADVCLKMMWWWGQEQKLHSTAFQRNLCNYENVSLDLEIYKFFTVPCAEWDSV